MLKKCLKCGALVEVLKDCTCESCGIKCCGQPMAEVKANSVDAAFEKHIPVYEVVGEYVVVSVNHVMEEEHFIEYISLESEKISAKKFFKAGESPKAIFPYVKGSKISSYCNKHGLWQTLVE